MSVNDDVWDAGGNSYYVADDGTILRRMAFAYPEQLSPARDESGKVISSRIKDHPTRPARVTDANTWWEEVAA